MDKVNSQGQNLTEFLLSYDASKYPRPSYTTDILVFSEVESRRRILLVKRANHPYIGEWAIPGGFVNKGETSEQCAQRELKEETSVEANLTQVYTVSTPNRDPRGWTISTLYKATIDGDTKITAGDDASKAQWFFVDFTRDDAIATLTLTSGKTVLTAQMQIQTNGKNIDVNNTKIISSKGIAFDHAKLIAYAIS